MNHAVGQQRAGQGAAGRGRGLQAPALGPGQWPGPAEPGAHPGGGFRASVLIWGRRHSLEKTVAVEV